MPQKTVEMIRKTESPLLGQLKRNQPTLYERLLVQVVPQPAATVYHSHEVGQHHRLERRTVSVWPLAAGMGTEPWHDHFQTFLQVERQTDVVDTHRKAWTPRVETAYYLATPTLTAAHAATLIRDPWGIENRLHYVRDVTLREDASRIRRNPGLFAVLHSFALNLLRFNGIQNVSQALYDNALDFNLGLTYQGL